MQKDTIEIYKWEKYTKGYSYCLTLSHKPNLDFENGIVESNGRPTESYIMDRIIDFTKDKNISVYKHSVRSEFVEKPEYGKYKPNGYDFDISNGDLIYYLDIYWQEK